MQTILGSNGQIGQELAKELHKNFTTDLRLVSRSPKKVNESDQLFPANLLNYEETNKAIIGSEIVYFTAGLPMDSKMWEEQFLIMMANVMKSCIENQTKLVFFDNTYMYAKNSEPQTEDSPFRPVGRKAVVRANMAQLLLDKMNAKEIDAVICRAPEFYGPGKTQSITNTMIFENINQGKKLRVPLNDSSLRTLIWTPDASRAMALIGNTEDAYGQTWHLPCDDSKTYSEIINFSEQILKKKLPYTVLKMWQFNLGSRFSHQLKELKELLPRYQEDNIFVSDKFKERFPEFKITTMEEGIQQIVL
ncbi:NAD-dependent epimerase/dehydratase family protein [Candidatus Enterococcus ikei]|uniref:NAD-dependent epimerase/dehydratase family protein n=1 Tax=Candidatus Enterococcus ikei TaxID=2815326 RepID=A0ABS3H246_9ENTE|nr:NAD-dependent epimerase/dehydratase family protein [Enterococcus sp. DIV0869a]MBO0441233.1 NAD-dependent epimerase/dehydratase family protein [Enterococcus sp. DIV0869a]